MEGCNHNFVLDTTVLFKAYCGEACLGQHFDEERCHFFMANVCVDCKSKRMCILGDPYSYNIVKKYYNPTIVNQ